MSTKLPIKTAPYQHQIDAYNFALRLFGGPEGGDAAPISRGVAYLMEMG